MENFKISDVPEMEDEELSNLVNSLKDVFTKRQQNFAEVCWGVYKIWDYCRGHYYQAKDNYYYNSYHLLEKFGFDKKAVSRLKACYDKFCQTYFNTVLEKEHIELKSAFIGFTPSKLYELLPLEDNVILDAINKGVVKSDMTVKAIRQAVKLLIHGDTPETLTSDATIETEEINEDEIPMAYDPTKEYDFEYFKAMSKNQLLNNIWTLQKAYQKLKKTRK